MVEGGRLENGKAMSLGGSNPSPSARRSRPDALLAAARRAGGRAFEAVQPALVIAGATLLPETPRVWTIGHGRADLDAILDLLAAHDIKRVVDVRSVPYSRWARWARRDTLPADLAPIEYRWMGDTLGGKGILDWEQRLDEPEFQWGIEHLIELTAERRTAILCSESKPNECHRRVLIGRALLARGIGLVHLLHNGTTWEEAPAVGIPPTLP